MGHLLVKRHGSFSGKKAWVADPVALPMHLVFSVIEDTPLSHDGWLNAQLT
jgi:hypothetical protein